MGIKSYRKKSNLALKTLNQVQCMIKSSALACDSCIMDKELQLTPDDYYLIFKGINAKIQEAINLLSD